jgi:hypothetical protein
MSRMSAPIDRIPDEVLREIFLEAGAEDDASIENNEEVRRLGANTAWIISRVYQRWEDISSHMQTTRVVLTEIGRVLVTRSGGGIDVTIDQDGDDLEYPAARRVLSMNIVFPVILTTGQLQQLKFQIRPGKFAELAQLVSGRVNQIQTLQMEFLDSPYGPERWTPSKYEQFWTIQTFRDMPHLHTVQLASHRC